MGELKNSLRLRGDDDARECDALCTPGQSVFGTSESPTASVAHHHDVSCCSGMESKAFVSFRVQACLPQGGKSQLNIASVPGPLRKSAHASTKSPYIFSVCQNLPPRALKAEQSRQEGSTYFKGH